MTEQHMQNVIFAGMVALTVIGGVAAGAVLGVAIGAVLMPSAMLDRLGAAKAIRVGNERSRPTLPAILFPPGL